MDRISQKQHFRQIRMTDLPFASNCTVSGPGSTHCEDLKQTIKTHTGHGTGRHSGVCRHHDSFFCGKVLQAISKAYCWMEAVRHKEHILWSSSGLAVCMAADRQRLQREGEAWFVGWSESVLEW